MQGTRRKESDTELNEEFVFPHASVLASPVTIQPRTETARVDKLQRAVFNIPVKVCAH